MNGLQCRAEGARKRITVLSIDDHCLNLLATPSRSQPRLRTTVFKARYLQGRARMRLVSRTSPDATADVTMPESSFVSLAGCRAAEPYERVRGRQLDTVNGAACILAPSL